MSFTNCFSCAPDHDPGILAGKDRDLPTHACEPLTTFFYNAIHRKAIHGKKTALSYYNRNMTFAELQFFSTVIANRLKDRLGADYKVLNPDDELVVAMLVPPSEKQIVIIFAILKMGAAYLPLDPELPEETLLDILTKFRPLMLITDLNGPIMTTYDKRSFGMDCMLLSLEEVWAELEVPREKSSTEVWDVTNDKLVTPLELQDRSVQFLDRPAVVLVTTGLFKDPKGVRISHIAILNRIWWYWKFLPYRKDGTCCLAVPLTFVESVNQIFAPLLKGITLHILNFEDVLHMGNFIKRLGEYRVTRVSLSASTLTTFIRECLRMGKDEARTVLQYLKFVNCKTEVVPYDLLQKFFDIFPNDNKRLCSLYGFPETSGDIICEEFDGMKKVKKKMIQGRVLVGEVCDNSQIYILNNTRDLAQDGEQGQICISGLPLALGYVNKKAKSDNTFQVNPYNNSGKYGRIFLTGDYGRFVKCSDNHYRLLIEGRADNFIHHNGYSFNTDDIKDTITEIPTVEHVTLVILNFGKPEQTIVAFVLPKADYVGRLTIESLVTQMKTRLPGYMIPLIKIIKEFPTLITGRLDRHLLIKNYESEKESGFTNWASINLHNRENLNAARVLLEGMFKYCAIPIHTSTKSLKSSIYQLGGNSLNTTRLVAYLNEQEFPINIQEFVSAKSIEDVINLMENRKTLHAFRHGTTATGKRIVVTKDTGAQHMYEIQTLENRHQREVNDLLTRAYTEKGPLFKYNLITYDDFSKFFNVCWPDIIEQHMSCVVVRKSDYRIVGVAINADFFMEVDSGKATGGLKDYVEFMFEVKGQVMNRMDIGEEAVNEIFECILLATLNGISPGDTIRIIMFLIEEMFRLANVDNFKSMYFATASPFLRELLTEAYDFKVLDDYIANEYSSDGAFKPFHLAPSTVSIASCYKVVQLPTYALNASVSEGKITGMDGDGLPASL